MNPDSQHQQVSINVVTEFERVKPTFEIGIPRIVSFHSATYSDAQGQKVGFSVAVHIENGDVYGLLSVVTENGGIGGMDDQGIYRFIPWPCCAVEVRNS